MKEKEKNNLLKQVCESEKFFHEVTKDGASRLTDSEIIWGFEEMQKLARCLKEVIWHIETERDSGTTGEWR